ncbi:alanyl-tRNA editing protein [Aliirhizobium terrae]|uniref:alanyl-tRNA editing protein n=1 Tax=Terrirhizobium terrae TaxID=2926709 RepID=UPI0025759437|nr:alanyl-tRNA editing protein [Rhizobium sp. CC-CFT758]WJH39830.1 alanyl-tRNA editing protein [Rhizobium sp. CC-CFT758]
MSSQLLFRDDFYLASTPAVVTAIHEDGGLEFDRTCFYATSGGQPGDTGFIERTDGSRVMLGQARHGATKDIVIHVPLEGQPQLVVGEQVTLQIDWPRRFNLMRMHTACHLLSVVCPYPVTGAAVGEEDARIDFDVTEPMDKDEVTARLMELVTADHPVYVQWITDEELAANPGIVKSKNVRPPIGLGRVSLVCIGESSSIDSQPCGGTHVARTSEIGAIYIAKIEKKGKENRRFRIRFGEPAEA